MSNDLFLQQNDSGRFVFNFLDDIHSPFSVIINYDQSNYKCRKIKPISSPGLHVKFKNTFYHIWTPRQYCQTVGAMSSADLKDSAVRVLGVY